MKILLLTFALVLLTTPAFARDSKIDKAESLLRNGDFSASIDLISEEEEKIGKAKPESQSRFYLLKGEAYLASAAADGDFNTMKTSAGAFLKAEELGGGDLQARLDAGMQQLHLTLVSSAINDQAEMNSSNAAEKLYIAYQLSKDPAELYYAAENSVDAGDFPTALKYYTELLDSGYTGIETEYVATEAATGTVVVFSTKRERDLALVSQKYTKPDERMTESIKVDLIQQVMLIYMIEGETEKALQIIRNARNEDPENIDLIRSEAEVVIYTGDFEKYEALMLKIIKSDPDNPDNYFELAVSAGELNLKDKALEYYRKALKSKPGETQAEINIAGLILRQEAGIVAEMNTLGTSAADTARYRELELQRNALYEEVIPYLESATSARPDDLELNRTLMNLYLQLGRVEQYTAMRAKLAPPAAEVQQNTTEANPTDEATLAFNRGIELYNNNKLYESIAAFEEAVEIQPEFSEAHFELGMTAFVMAENEKAKLHLKKYLSLDPGGEQAETATMIVEGLTEETGAIAEPTDSDSEFQAEPAELADEAPVESGEAGELNLLAGELDKYMSLEELIDPELVESSQLAFDRGMQLYEEGLLDDAITAFEEAVNIRPGFSEAVYELGMLAFVNGEYDKARLNLENFLDLVPEGEQVETARFILEGID